MHVHTDMYIQYVDTHVLIHICSVLIHTSVLDQRLQFRFIHLSSDLLFDIHLQEVNEHGENG